MLSAVQSHVWSENGLCACSNAADLLKWYNTVVSKPEAVSLSKQSLADLLAPLQPVGPLPPYAPQNASFAQGIVVEPLSESKKVLRLSSQNQMQTISTMAIRAWSNQWHILHTPA
jgi:hypothetical protein